MIIKYSTLQQVSRLSLIQNYSNCLKFEMRIFLPLLEVIYGFEVLEFGVKPKVAATWSEWSAWSPCTIKSLHKAQQLLTSVRTRECICEQCTIYCRTGLLDQNS